MMPAPSSSSSPTAVSASEESHDDAAEADDAADNGLENAADAAYDRHNAAAYGGESRFDLEQVSYLFLMPQVGGCISPLSDGTYAR